MSTASLSASWSQMSLTFTCFLNDMYLFSLWTKSTDDSTVQSTDYVFVLAHMDHRRTNVHGCVTLDQAEVDVGHDHAGVQRGRRLVETAEGLIVI